MFKNLKIRGENICIGKIENYKKITDKMSLSHVWLFVIPRPVACKAPLSMGFSRQKYWSGLPFPAPGDLSDPGINPRSPALQADSLPFEISGRAGGKRGDRGWDGWIASPTQWTWVWVNSGRWWRTGEPGVLQSTGPQRVRHNLATEQQQQIKSRFLKYENITLRL